MVAVCKVWQFFNLSPLKQLYTSLNKGAQLLTT